MIRTVLVPLDGSVLSERALPLAVNVAKAANAELKFVHVAPEHNHVAHPLPPTAQGYLDLMTYKVRQMAGLPATSALLHGPVAETLAESATGLKADLIVLSTHGRGALSRMWLGSVADQLIRRTTVPVLLVRPGEEPRPDAVVAPRGFRRILIALDGSTASEATIGPAVELGRPAGAEYTLLRVIEPIWGVSGDGMAYLPSAYDGQLFDELVKQAEAQMNTVAERMRRDGLTVKTQVVVGEAPAPAILEAAKSADLTVLATHGRSGAARVFLGSVADKVVRGADGPVLLAHATGP
ncbi:MAG: universal stress protein [Gemmataceae bacterium]